MKNKKQTTMKDSILQKIFADFFLAIALFTILTSPLVSASISIKEPSTNQLALYTGGTEWLRINASGAVAIGKSNPTAMLDVNGSINVSGIGANIYVGNVAICLANGTNCNTQLPFALGGTVTYDGAYTIHTFNTTGTLGIYGTGTVEYLIVAGGGGGGGMGGGGGAGGFLTGFVNVTPGYHTITVGTGGTGTPDGFANMNIRGTNGGSSSFNNITATGGGGGGAWINNAGSGIGATGGSGGGGSNQDGSPPSTGGGNAGGSGTAGQGYAGGAGYPDTRNYGPGGGGGSGAAGTTATGVNGGNGGIGNQSSISGTATYYAGGGGGGEITGTAGTGGNGGGGNGGTDNNPGSDGTPATGGGGGGGGYGGGYYGGGDGGSGIVIVKYLTAIGGAQINTGNVTSTATAGYIPQMQSNTILNNSIIYQNGSNIGIGTNAPISTLDVRGNVSLNQTIYVTTNGNFGIGTNAPARLLTLDAPSIPALGFYTSGSERAKISADTSNNLIFDAGNSEKMRISSAGYVGIGITAPSSQLHINGSTTVGGAVGSIKLGSTAGNPNSGLTIGYTESASAYLQSWGGYSLVLNDLGNNVGIGDATPDYALDVYGTICQDTDSNDVCDGTVTSDIRLKTNITTIPNAINKVQQLKGVYFYWNESENATEHLGRGNRQVGMIAQEVEAIFPELIYEDKQGYKMIDYQKITGLLIQSTKEQQLEIENLKKEIDLLKKHTFFNST